MRSQIDFQKSENIENIQYEIAISTKQIAKKFMIFHFFGPFLIKVELN